VDIYGLGCVAYWLLTGERVFTGRTPMEVLMHHVKTPPVPPSQRAQRPIPQGLEALVLACLAKEPEERPASAESLAESLAACSCALDVSWSAADARAWWGERGLDTGRAPSPKSASLVETRSAVLR
jgi:serine/threonine-protein kinase